ncbi:MAG: hypothetical protein Q7V57_07575 [Actinomycetota bacterium]|nr:hypothetical protein [Actinomycetota bacterium]
MLDHPLALFGVLGEPGQDARQRRRDRVEAGDRKQVHDVDDLVLVELMTIDLEVDEGVDQVVVARPGAQPFLQPLAQVLTQLLALRAADPLALLHRGALVLEDPVLALDEEVEIGERQTEDLHEDGGGQRRAEGRVHLRLAGTDEPIDEPIGGSADGGFQQLHLRRREQRVDQLAEVLVNVAVEV